MITNATTASSTGPGTLITAVLSGAVLAAVLGAFVNVWLARRKSLDEERSRVRTTCAEAFEAVTAYKEFPYAIRRRNHLQPEEERTRLSDELRHVQSRLSYFTAWMAGESPDLGTSYVTLVSNLRRIAGTACHDAWLAPPATSDSDMNFSSGVVDLAELGQYETAYIAAVQTYLQRLVGVKRLWLGR